MRVLIASDLHWPAINGIATFGRNLAHGLASQGHDVMVVAPSPTGKPCEEDDGDHRVVRIRALAVPFYQNLRISSPTTRQMRRLIRSFDPDVVHVQTPMGIGVAIVAAAKRCDVPLVATNHSMSENFIDNLKFLHPVAGVVDRWLRAFGERFHARADHVTLPTRAAIDMLKPDGFQRPTSAISNGIDLARFHPGEAPEGLREQLGIPREVPVVLYVGRLDVEKHLHVLIEAARRVKETSAPFHLVLVGLGIDRGRLEHLADTLGIRDRVTFTGRVEEEVKQDIFRLASVFAMPSPAELQSISTLEAMASGLPVVAVNAGALPELCRDGENGLRFELDDAEGMAAGIVRLLSDGDLARSMGQASIAIASRHDLRETIRQFVALYERVIAEHATETVPAEPLATDRPGEDASTS